MKPHHMKYNKGGYQVRELPYPEYIRRRIPRYSPLDGSHESPQFADLYTELYRFKEGYYAIEVEAAREQIRQTPLLERQPIKTLDHLNFCHSVRAERHLYLKDIIYLEVSGESCTTAIYGMGKSTLSDMVEELGMDLYCLYAGITANGRDIGLMYKTLYYEHEKNYIGLKFMLKTKYGIEVITPYPFENLRVPVTYDQNAVIKAWCNTRFLYSDHYYSKYLESQKDASEQSSYFRSIKEALFTDKWDVVEIIRGGYKGYFIRNIDEKNKIKMRDRKVGLVDKVQKKKKDGNKKKERKGGRKSKAHNLPVASSEPVWDGEYKPALSGHHPQYIDPHGEGKEGKENITD